MAQTLVSRRVGWISAAIIGGFVATVGTVVALLLAYAVALGLSQTLGGVVGQWLHGLTNNILTQTAQNVVGMALLMHIAFGLVWAVIYAAFFESRLPGPGWQRGITFSFLPWFLSLTVFFPIVGGGFLGFGLGAGPLPILGNLVLHALYGAILGATYGLGNQGKSQQDRFTSSDRIANDGAEHGIAIGVIAGGIGGAILAFFVSIGMSVSANHSLQPWLLTLTGLGLGMVVGALVGSFVGLGETQHT